MPPGFPLTINSVLSCFHQFPAKIAPKPAPVTILGQPVATPLAQIGVIGCLFAPGGVASPCVTIKWTGLATKVSVQAQPLLLMPPPFIGPGPGVCIGPAPQGVPTLKGNQAKVFAA
jgi:hypothetical protein